MFVDEAVIEVRSGQGGHGCVSFRREKYIPKGGPDGGDGGDGGSVILLADPQVSTLMDFSGRHHWHAQNGQPGTSKQRHGRDGEDLTIHLPPGTLVYHNETNALLVDLNQPGQTFVLAKGGRGGFGNEHFKGPTNQTPTESTPGEPSTCIPVRLELKLIADVGIVGKPNAGKSTLLSRITRAQPKVADYPFTTLTPQLGIAQLSPAKPGNLPIRIVFADIPGLIEHAHEGHGLGTRFLRHIERTRMLVHLLEVEPADGSSPTENYMVIRKELEAYSKTLAKKSELLVLSKAELLGDHNDRKTAIELIREDLAKVCDRVPPMLTISSATGEGLPELLETCLKMVEAARKEASA